MEMYFQSKNISNYFCVSYNVENERTKLETIKVEMLERNDIPFLLRPIHMLKDDQFMLYYNTDAKYVLSKLFQRIKPDGAWIQIFISQLATCIENLPKYLLAEEDLVLDPDYMFYDYENMRLHFVYVPSYGKDIRFQLKSFLEYLMPIFDYRDRQGFLFSCQIYDKVLTEDIPLRYVFCQEEMNSYVEKSNLHKNEMKTVMMENEVAQQKETRQLENEYVYEETQHFTSQKNTIFRLVPLTNGSLEDLVLEEEITVRIGRGKKESDYRIKNAQISREHAVIIKELGELWVEDMGSTNGTYVNATRIQEREKIKLKTGDIVGFANEEFFVLQ